MVQPYHFDRWGAATPQESCTLSGNSGILILGDRRIPVTTTGSVRSTSGSVTTPPRGRIG